MANYQNTPPITFTSPATASTVVQTATWDNLSQFEWLTVVAVLTGATAGTLDVYLQAEAQNNVWVDWVHFAQLAAGAATVRYAFDCNVAASSITTVGGGTTAAPGVALAAATVAFSHPGKKVRIVTVAGAGTSAGASQTLYLMKWRHR